MKPLVLITVALGCGLVAAVGFYQQMDNAGATQETEKVNVVVATREVNINEALTEENVELVQWARDQVLEGTVTSLEELEGAYARTRLYPGEAILSGKVIDSTKPGTSILVPTGYRVVSVEVSLDSSVSNLIEPGDRVDVIVVLRERGETAAMAKTILSAVRVFAVNSHVAPSLDPEESPEDARAVSLILKPDQIEKLMMATEIGTIKLSLRCPDDDEISETEGCGFAEMLGQVSVADDVSDGKVVLDGGLSKRQPAQQDPSQPYWSMVVQSPGNAHQFDLASRNGVWERKTLYTTDSDSSDSDTGSDTASGGQSDVEDLDDLGNDVGVTDYSDADE